MVLTFPTLTCCFRSWLWNIARGISGEEVESRLLPKSHGCGKTFPGPQALKSTSSVRILSPCKLCGDENVGRHVFIPPYIYSSPEACN